MKFSFARTMVILVGCIAGLVGLTDRSAWATQILPPLEFQFGDNKLVLNGTGTRILYYMRVYNCALYLPKRSQSLDYITDPDTPVAIRIQVIYDDPPDTLPERWRHAVRSELSDKMYSRMRRAYQNVSGGDVIVFAYAPQHGTMVLINDRLIVVDAGHGLMSTLLEQWVGATAISDRLRLALVGN